METLIQDTVIHVRLATKVLRKLQALAHADHRSVSNMIRLLIEKALETK